MSSNQRRLRNDLKKFRRKYPERPGLDQFRIGNETKMSEYETLLNTLERGEDYRIVITASMLSVLGLIVALSWCSTCFKTSALFILSIVSAFVGLLILHFAVGAQFSISVALSDLCIKPAQFIERSVLVQDWLNENEVDIWLNCERDSNKISRYKDLYEDLHSRRVSL